MHTTNTRPFYDRFLFIVVRVNDVTARMGIGEEIGFIGTPDRVIEQIRRLRAQAPVTELAIVSNFGGLEHWKVIKTQELFARHVMPAFR